MMAFSLRRLDKFRYLNVIKLQFYIKFLSLLLLFFRRFRKIAKSDYFVMSVHLSVRVSPSVRMDELGFHWTNFDETLYLSFFRNSSFINIREEQRVLYMETFRHI